MSKKVLIVESRYYEDISNLLLEATIEQLNVYNVKFEKMEVLGALEIPILIKKAIITGKYDGFIALGCVIRGETSHYDIVSNNSAKALIDLAINNTIPISNGILTVDNKEQALVRACKTKKNNGGHASKAVSYTHLTLPTKA